jgi:hypothetical protein
VQTASAGPLVAAKYRRFAVRAMSQGAVPGLPIDLRGKLNSAAFFTQEMTAWQMITAVLRVNLFSSIACSCHFGTFVLLYSILCSSVVLPC